MWTYRVTYVIALAGSLAFHALYPFWFSWYLFILVLLLVPFDLFFSMPGMFTKRVSPNSPNILEQGADGTLVITTYQEKPYPSGRIKASLLVTGDDFAVRRRIICSPENGSKYEIDIDTSHSGVTVFGIKRIHTTSLIGLFSISSAVNRSVTTLILPAPVKPPHIVSLPRGVILRPKPGGGFSEDNELRPYRKGDPIKIIHWKLSAKHDSLIIREPLMPPSHSRLVHVMKWSGARERDLILGRLRWISDYLLKWDLPYCVKLGDDGLVAEITCAGDFMEYLCGMLDNAAHSLPVPVSLPVRFSWVFRVDAKEEVGAREEADAREEVGAREEADAKEEPES